MAVTLTITQNDDGSLTVESPELEKPYECESVAECLDYVKTMLGEEAGESPEEQATEPKENYEEMWNEEAGKRQSIYG